MTRSAFKPRLVGAALALASAAVPALAAAQMTSHSMETNGPVPNPPPSTTNNNPHENADPGYMGERFNASFRDIDARIAAAETGMRGNRHAMMQLRAIKAEAAQRRARHGGELRDWDRELLNKKLDMLHAG